MKYSKRVKYVNFEQIQTALLKVFLYILIHL